MASTESARWERLKALLADAVDLDPAERVALLDRLDDIDLRTDVEALLAAHDEAEAVDRFEEPAFGAEGRPDTLDTRVGPYRLAEEIGRGGMGTVYRAERADGAFEQTVALKLLPPGLASTGSAERFRAERQILARLEHPHIARLLDGGVTDPGTLGREMPWLAMEFIDGIPLTAYAEQARLSVEARVRLFLQVCEAVAYAHHNLVVHRDLKPSNILVAENERGEPQVKLLDFGIAKLIETEESSQALTRTGMRVMTPEYAAPEQVRGETVTTATDVYALGVLLYELLTGARPYDVSGLSPSDIERTICDTTPTRPSSSVQPTEYEVETLAAQRLRGDLDTVILKALAKEPAQRYPGADALAADLHRHLDGRPVDARPATASYRARKFVARHRASVAVAALVSLALLVGLGSALWQGRIAATERDRAEAAADQATAVTAFLRSTFAEASPAVGPPVPASELLLVDGLRQALQQVEASFPDQPDVRAAVLHTLGETYLDLGLYDEAAPPLLTARALRDSLYPEPHAERIETLDALGLLSMWEHTLSQTDSFYVRSLDLRERLYGPRSAEYSRGLTNLAEWLTEYGDNDRAYVLAREAVDVASGATGPESEDTGYAMFVLGRVQLHTGAYAAADSTLSTLLALMQDLLPQDDPRFGEGFTVLGTARLLRGDIDRAEPVLREALAQRTARYDIGHPDLAETQGTYAVALVEQERYPEAERLLRAALPTFRTGNPYAYSEPLAVVELAIAEAGQGQAVALDSVRAAVDELRIILGPEHGWTRHAARHLAALDRTR